ncbi:MAG TPA: hypothetical protein PLD20_07160 [Blastocatellia bacterium]|nr:hypothetical protein [Blastocatellia bacterium]HMY71860.1 hypothetical protein [Blastocatellia bacterium]HMZ17689.1 hypothetical protein [Blastocatellia bacterium]HNG34894.1 hypothetical protein [Blastocatellia bacterium]
MKKTWGLVFWLLGVVMIVAAAEGREQTAQQAVAAQRFGDAREIYRQLLKEQPENPVYQIWVARLSAWMKDYEVAVKTYDLVLAREQNNLEALLGKAYVRMWQHRYAEAEALLEQVKQETGEQLAWRIAMFSLCSLRGNLKGARRHLEQVRVLDPQNPELSALEKQLHGREPLTVQAGYETQRLQYLSPDIPAFNSFSLDVVWRRERSTLGFHIEKDYLGSSRWLRGGWSFSHRLGDRLWLRGSALFGTGAQVLPQLDWSTGAALRLKGRLAERFVIGGDYRRIRLPQTTAHVVSPTVEYVPSDRTHWQVTVFRSWQPQANGNGLNGLSFLLRYDRQLTKPLRAGLTWTQVRQTSQCGAQCSSPVLHQRGWSGALSYEFSERLRLNLHYGQLRNANGARQSMFGAGFTVH